MVKECTKFSEIQKAHILLSIGAYSGDVAHVLSSLQKFSSQLADRLDRVEVSGETPFHLLFEKM